VENKRTIGSEKERLAREYLEKQGYQILECNFYSSYGEIDIIANDGRWLVFLEVKYRKSLSAGYPAEAVNRQKRQKLYQTAQYYLYKNRLPESTPCRFDVVAILGDKLEHIKDGFGGL